MSLQKLRTAIRDAQDGVADYKEKVLLLFNYAGQVKSYSFPVLSTNPSWYQEAARNWAQMSGTLASWGTTTLASLYEEPATLIEDDSLTVAPTLTAAIGFATALVQEPGNEVDRAALMRRLRTLSSSFAEYAGKTTALVVSLMGQAPIFDANAATMKTLVAQALKEQGVDQAKIAGLTQLIERLRSDIKSQIGVIVGGSIVTVLGVVMGVVAVALTPVTGGASLALLVPALAITAGGATAITLAAKQIERDKADIAAATSQINQITADVTLLADMGTALSGLAGQVDAAKSALSIVVAPWEAADIYFDATIAQLAAIETATSEQWQAVVDELTLIQTEWVALIGVMQQLSLDGAVSTRNLAFDMDADQVRAQIAATPQLPLPAYIGA